MSPEKNQLLNLDKYDLPSQERFIQILSAVETRIRSYDQQLNPDRTLIAERIRISGLVTPARGKVGRISALRQESPTLFVFECPPLKDQWKRLWRGAKISFANFQLAVEPLFEDDRPYSRDGAIFILKKLYDFFESVPVIEVQLETKNTDGKWNGIGRKMVIEDPFKDLL